MSRPLSLAPALGLIALALGCTTAPTLTEPVGDPVDPTTPADQQAEWDALMEQLEALEDLDTDEFLATHTPTHIGSLPYDPLDAEFIDLIQASEFALDGDEMAVLGDKGFMISERQNFENFVQGYEFLYFADLPLFVSADSIMHAVHKSYGDILQAIETSLLMGDLAGMLDGMRDQLAGPTGAAFPDQTRQDADVYLAVARSLLEGSIVAPVAGGSADTIRRYVEGALSESGMVTEELFGAPRLMDWSQFTPRGHYTDTEALTRYFQAMMWLGRVDLRLIETQPDHSQMFHRRQFEGAVALATLINTASHDHWTRMEQTIQTFVGESDNMTLPEMEGLLSDLGATTLGDLEGVSDEAIAQAILDGGYGTQRISSHIMINGLGQGTMPLSSTFMLLGQRYVVDSHVFSNVVYDRVQGGGSLRMMPDPLDVAFAALGNDQAAVLLEDELHDYGYAPDLAAMRMLVDAHGDDYWATNLYTLWLGALRPLSPVEADLADPASGLPSVARSEAWGRRMLNTQLASWAELRHDTILYAKQSYTGGAACAFPDAYVDPYPAAFAAIGRYAEAGAALVADLDLASTTTIGPAIAEYFSNLDQAAGILEAMAANQRAGEPHTMDQLAFINRAVTLEWGCDGPIEANGWFPELYFDQMAGPEYDPVIADVHTQPTDEVGSPVGHVLHVGTGRPRLMVSTFETCEGPRAYVGLVSSYFETVTQDFERLDDDQWAADLNGGTPDDVPWLRDLVVR